MYLTATHVILAPGVKRGQRSVDQNTLEQLRPLSEQSLPMTEAQELIPDLNMLIEQKVVVTCSQPLLYFWADKVWLCVRQEASYRRSDKHMAIEVQDCYFLHVFDLTTIQTVLDIGGQIGSFTVYLKLLAPQATVIVLEPELSNFEVLQINLDGIEGVYAYNRAASSNSDAILVKHLSHSGMHRVITPEQCATIGQSDDSFDVTETAVQTIGLQALLEQHPFDYVDLMKMDCEGCELDLLLHTPEDTLRQVRHIVGEYHTTAADFVSLIIKPLLDIFQLTLHTRGMVTCGYFLAVNDANPLHNLAAGGSSPAVLPALHLPLTIDFRKLVPGSGWHTLDSDDWGQGFRWMNGRVATLDVPITVTGDAKITFQVYWALSIEQLNTLHVSVNASPLAFDVIEGDGLRRIYQLYIPQTLAARRKDRLFIRFEVATVHRPIDVMESADTRTLGVAFSWLTIEPVRTPAIHPPSN